MENINGSIFHGRTNKKLLLSNNSARYEDQTKGTLTWKRAADFKRCLGWNREGLRCARLFPRFGDATRTRLVRVGACPGRRAQPSRCGRPAATHTSTRSATRPAATMACRILTHYLFVKRIKYSMIFCYISFYFLSMILVWFYNLR